ncbi:hypothetical protein CIRG_04407 [Coccidioides immitis RMSCC 2394]|uniref:Uncharacterized protein n=1 Tax=Coccidioides immitis RMSCC 2394 TaxID=404692 RepID=A0A0J6Y7S4_COCIT|nr:hypothetical protein CIRG_04407 [Coccidioides immitis RMSCC 2394]
MSHPIIFFRKTDQCFDKQAVKVAKGLAKRRLGLGICFSRPAYHQSYQGGSGPFGDQSTGKNHDCQVTFPRTATWCFFLRLSLNDSDDWLRSLLRVDDQISRAKTLAPGSDKRVLEIFEFGATCAGSDPVRR